jgi:hypothetical protein
MNTTEIIFTTINVCLTLVSVVCAIYSSRQTKFQTDIMKQQLEESQKPDLPLTSRLEGISRAIYSVSDNVKSLNKNK